MKSHQDVCALDYRGINRHLLELSDEKYPLYANKKISLDISSLYFFVKNALIEIAREPDKVVLIIRASWGGLRL